MKAKHYIQLSF